MSTPEGAVALGEVHGSRIADVPALDGLRGVAVLAVMAYHASHWATGGFLGVDVFFTLSGFLITSILVRERIETGTISLRRFYVRRGLRILPGLLAMLLAYLAVAAWLDLPRLLGHAIDAGLVLLPVANLPRAFSMGRPIYMAPAWSLAVEEHFYLLWPLLLGWLVPRVKDARRLAVVCLASALCVWAARVTLLDFGVSRARLYYLLDTRADGLLAGCALGALHGASAIPGPWFAAMRRAAPFVAVGVATAWCALLLTARFDDSSNHVWRFALVTFTTTLVIASAACAPDGTVARVLSWTPLARVGRISYGLYLWHYPIFLALFRDGGLSLGWTAAVGSPLVFAGAAASYHWVERPALRWKSGFA